MPNNKIFIVRGFRENRVTPVKKVTQKDKSEKVDDLVEFLETNKNELTDSPYYTSAFFKSIFPVVFFLRIFGMFFKRYKSKGTWHCDRWTIMCILICVVQVFNCCRACAIFNLDEELDDLLFFKIQTALWTLENTVKVLAIVCACFRKNKLPLFFQLWVTTCNDKPLDTQLKVIMKMALIISTNFVIINMTGLVLVFFYIPELEDLFLHMAWPGAVGTSNTMTYKIVFVFCTFLNSGIAMYSITFMIVLCFSLSREFYQVTDQISSNVDDDGGFQTELEPIRLRHQCLCRMAGILDDCFTVVIAIVYITNLPMSCVILYNAIYVKHTITLTLFNIFWMVFLQVHMVLVSVVCALINVAAHRPLEELYRISATHLQKQQVQLIMFMNRLTGSEIGLTAIKMFVINRPTILTVIGMLVTYFVLLVQFKTPATAICYCSSNTTTS